MGDVVLSGSTTTTVPDESPFSLYHTRRETLSQLPDVLVPSSREPSPGFDLRVESMKVYIEKSSAKTPKNLPTLLNLITGDLGGFVVGAASWGEEQPVKKESGEEAKIWQDKGFASYEEEAEAFRQFESSVPAGGGYRYPGLTSWNVRPSPKKKRRLNKEGRTPIRVDPPRSGITNGLEQHQAPRGFMRGSMQPAGQDALPEPGLDEPPRPRTPPAPHNKVSSALQGSPFKPASLMQRPMGVPGFAGEGDPTVAGPSRPRGNFNPNISAEFYPPSFPSDLMTSTPAPTNRQKPPPIISSAERSLGLSAAVASPGFRPAARFRANVPIRPLPISRPLQAFKFTPANPEPDHNASTRRSSSVVSDPEADQEPPDPPSDPAPEPQPQPEPEPERVTLADLWREPTVDDLLNAPAEQRRLEMMADRPVKKLPRRSGSGVDKWHRDQSRVHPSEGSSLIPQHLRPSQKLSPLGFREPSVELIEPVEEKANVRRRRSSLSSSSTASSHQRRDADGGGGSEEDHVRPPASRSSSPSAERSRRPPSELKEKPRPFGGLKFNDLAPPSQKVPRPTNLKRLGSRRSNEEEPDDQQASGQKERLSGAMPPSSSSSLGAHAAFQSQFDVERNMNAIGEMLEEDVWP
ncbi:hypothetical protein FRB90_005741 [Tulasnella sp. 427]|nr:hypothetical protein FRB90_005741 [Tulasnella sp. 427]